MNRDLFASPLGFWKVWVSCKFLVILSELIVLLNRPLKKLSSFKVSKNPKCPKAKTSAALKEK